MPVSVGAVGTTSRADLTHTAHDDAASHERLMDVQLSCPAEERMELWHEVAGEGSPVLLIHEGICDSRMWESQWRTLSAVHRTVRCDLRGFGQRPLPAEHYSNARDVVELLDRLELGPAMSQPEGQGGGHATRRA